VREVLLVPERGAGEKPSRPTPSGALESARRLVKRECDRPAKSRLSPDGIAEALYRACDLVVRNLRESMGDDGCDALFARAISRTEALHPVIKQLRDSRESGLSRAHLSDAVTADEGAARAGVESLLAGLIEILARLIGEDMALRIIDRDSNRDLPPPDASGAPS